MEKRLNKKGEVVTRNVVISIVLVALLIGGFYLGVEAMNEGYNNTLTNPYSNITADILGDQNHSFKDNITLVKESISEEGATEANPSFFNILGGVVFDAIKFVLGSFVIVTKMLWTIGNTLGIPPYWVGGIATALLLAIVFIAASAMWKHRV